MKMYMIVANVMRLEKGLSVCKQIPAFYLNSDIQGIVSKEHAEKIAREMLESINPDAAIAIGVELGFTVENNGMISY